MIFDYLFLPVLFFIGLIISYQDFKEGKIRNKWIILGLVWSLGIYILFLVWALLAPYLSQIYSREFTFVLPSYILKVFINSAIALVVGYLFWYFDLWSAGDAKLFFVFSLLLPLKYYWRTTLPYFPSFTLLINIFIPILLFLIGQDLFRLFKKIFPLKNISQIIKNNFLKLRKQLKTNYYIYSKTIFGFFLIFMGFRIIRLELSNWLNQYSWWSVAIVLLLVLVRQSLKKVFQKKWFLILFCLVIIFYLGIGYFFYAQGILTKLNFLIKGSLFFMIIFALVLVLVSRIEEGQKKHLPFAIWVLIGTLITMALKGSLIFWLLNPASFFK